MSPAIIIAAIMLGLIPAFIARRKGDSFIAYWIFGALLFIVALPVSIFMKDKRRRCPHCAEFIRPEANVCPHCQRDLNPTAAPAT
jgi:hypothetical protein